MPTYRRPSYLRLALASAVGQTYRNLQIIVRDNASGDETPEVVRSFGDARIEFLQSPATGTAWENGTECLKRIKGKYMVPLCDDDIFGDNYIETLIPFLENDSTVLAAYGATYVIDETGAVTRKCVPEGTVTWQAGDIVRAWHEGTLPLASGINYVCPTSFILDLGDKHCFPDGHHSDNAIFMAAGIRGKVVFTDRCIFYYRVYSGNSQRKHPCQLRAKGDIAFLAFLDAEVDSQSNVGLCQAEWPGLRRTLQAMFASNYFHHLRRFRMDKDSLMELLCDATIWPSQAYGLRNTLKGLRQTRKSLMHASWHRVRFGPHKVSQC